MKVMTEVSAAVEPGREAHLLGGFRQLLAEPRPDGLERTELLRARDGASRIQTLWRDQAALDHMGAAPEPPAASQLLRQVGADPVLVVFRVEVSTDDD